MTRIAIAVLAFALLVPSSADARRPHVRIHKAPPAPTQPVYDVPLAVVPPLAMALDLVRRSSCDPAVNRPYGKGDPGYPGGAQVGNFLTPAIYVPSRCPAPAPTRRYRARY